MNFKVGIITKNVAYFPFRYNKCCIHVSSMEEVEKLITKSNQLFKEPWTHGIDQRLFREHCEKILSAVNILTQEFELETVLCAILSFPNNGDVNKDPKECEYYLAPQILPQSMYKDIPALQENVSDRIVSVMELEEYLKIEKAFFADFSN